MVDRPRYPRSTCCVPGCTRWSTLFQHEWLCARHWKSVPLELRKFFRRRQRDRLAKWLKADAAHKAARAAYALPDGTFRVEHLNAAVEATMARQRAWRAYWRSDELLWRRIKREAILRAAGL